MNVVQFRQWISGLHFRLIARHAGFDSLGRPGAFVVDFACSPSGFTPGDPVSLCSPKTCKQGNECVMNERFLSHGYRLDIKCKT